MGLLAVISPAKTIDFSDNRADHFSQPRFEKETQALVNNLKKKRAPALMELMSISEQLGQLNVDRYRSFETPFTEENAKQAILAFKGDVYTGLEAEGFSNEDLDYAQNHLRILSGLYGLLRPLDLMQAYRLEMGTRLKIRRATNLYQFWGEKITKALNADLAETNNTVLLNLASKEYFKAIKPKQLAVPVVTVDFKENRNGVYKVISFTAKKARGDMSKHIIQQRIEQVNDLKDLKVLDYTYNAELSTEDHLLFTTG